MARRNRILAKKMIDAGATAIFGSHPHVIQPIEIYKGKPIFYSLGNFVFDQYFSEETQTGLTLSLEMSEDSMRFTLQPVEVTGAQVSPADPLRTSETLESLARRSQYYVPEGIAQDIEDGEFTISLK
jgi:poly-gamma-glutamate synthesis protein (capsule biosynthesis protein)